MEAGGSLQRLIPFLKDLCANNQTAGSHRDTEARRREQHFVVLPFSVSPCLRERPFFLEVFSRGRRFPFQMRIGWSMAPAYFGRRQRHSERRLHTDGRQHGEHADARARGRGVAVVVEVEQHVRAFPVCALSESPSFASFPSAPGRIRGYRVGHGGRMNSGACRRPLVRCGGRQRRREGYPPFPICAPGRAGSTGGAGNSNRRYRREEGARPSGGAPFLLGLVSHRRECPPCGLSPILYRSSSGSYWTPGDVVAGMLSALAVGMEPAVHRLDLPLEWAGVPIGVPLRIVFLYKCERIG